MEVMEDGKVYTIYLSVNKAELIRILDRMDEHIAEGMKVYAQLENVIKQGTDDKRTSESVE